MIADELSQDDIDALLGNIGGGDAGGGMADDALAALTGGGGDEAPAAAAAVLSTPVPQAAQVSLPEFSAEAPSEAEASQEIDGLLSNVPVNVKIRLGRTKMLVEDLLRLKGGKVLQLDTMSGDPVDILANDRVVAKGEVIILNEAFCVRISEVYAIRDKLNQQA